MREMATFSLVFLLLACAGFNYHYYGVGPDANGELKGTILAHEPKDDRPLSDCSPDAQMKGKCVLLKTDEFERILADLRSLQAQLKACQAGR